MPLQHAFPPWTPVEKILNVGPICSNPPMGGFGLRKG
jgi:hypothetical protein